MSFQSIFGGTSPHAPAPPSVHTTVGSSTPGKRAPVLVDDLRGEDVELLVARDLDRDLRRVVLREAGDVEERDLRAS